MELDDCAFPLLSGIDVTDDLKTAFDGTNVALLVGARPRTAGMERGDLLEANGGIFGPQGKAINDHAAMTSRCSSSATRRTRTRSSRSARAGRAGRAVHRDDPARPQPRALAARGEARGAGTAIEQMTIWGNHSATQYPDLYTTQVNGKSAAEQVEEEWLRTRSSRPSPSAAQRSSRPAARRRRRRPRTPRSTTSTTGSTAPSGRPRRSCPTARTASRKGIISSFPCRAVDGEWQIIDGVEINDFSRGKIDARSPNWSRSATR